MSDLKEYRVIGSHAVSLVGGRMVETGGFTGPIDPSHDEHKQLIDDGQLTPVKAGTYKKEYDQDPPDAAVRLTGDSLSKRAAELDIEGRSDMNADQLRAAVAEREEDQS
jgi:hypothetical protein